MKNTSKSGNTVLLTKSFLLLFLFSFSLLVRAQDITNQIQEFDITIDKLGDAKFAISEKMTQSQWESFKQGPLMNDPSISLRNMQRAMSTYVIEDFKRDIDEMNRSVIMSFKLKAYANYEGNGDWQLKLDSKNPMITKLSDNAYMSTSNLNLNGALVQQIYKIYFPKGASNIQQTTDSFGKALFTYKSGGGFISYFSWNVIVGILFIISAILVYFTSSNPEAGKKFININKRISPASPFTNLPPAAAAQNMPPITNAPPLTNTPPPVNAPQQTSTPPPSNLPPHV